MKQRLTIALAGFANVLGWVFIVGVILGWAFELGRALGRGVLIP